MCVAEREGLAGRLHQRQSQPARPPARDGETEETTMSRARLHGPGERRVMTSAKRPFSKVLFDTLYSLCKSLIVHYCSVDKNPKT